VGGAGAVDGSTDEIQTINMPRKLATPESKEGSPKVNFPFKAIVLKVERAHMRAFEGIHIL
jgi:hypothetical protein